MIRTGRMLHPPSVSNTPSRTRTSTCNKRQPERKALKEFNIMLAASIIGGYIRQKTSEVTSWRDREHPSIATTRDRTWRGVKVHEGVKQRAY